VPEELINIDKKIDAAHNELMKQMRLALSHGAMTPKELCVKTDMCNHDIAEFTKLVHTQSDSIESIVKIM